MSHQIGDTVSVHVDAGAPRNVLIVEIRGDGKLLLEVSRSGGGVRRIARSPAFVGPPIPPPTTSEG